jgi:hypothetical protein
MAMTMLQFELLVHNAFGLPPAEQGFTIEERDGEPVAVKDGHVLRLMVVGETATHWEVDGQRFMPFAVRGRNSPVVAQDRERLNSVIAGDRPAGADVPAPANVIIRGD